MTQEQAAQNTDHKVDNAIKTFLILIAAAIVFILAAVVYGAYAQSINAVGMCYFNDTWVPVDQHTLDHPPFGYNFCHKS